MLSQDSIRADLGQQRIPSGVVLGGLDPPAQPRGDRVYIADFGTGLFKSGENGHNFQCLLQVGLTRDDWHGMPPSLLARRLYEVGQV